MGITVKLVRASDLRPGSFRCFEVDGKRIVLYNAEGAVYATSAICAHMGGPLEDGLFEGTVVTCPWHAWQFDVRTGEAIYDPKRRIATYPVKVIDDEIHVEI